MIEIGDIVISKQAPTDEQKKFMEHIIHEENKKRAGIETEGEYFSYFIYGNDNGIVAGIIGWTWGSVCEIDTFWVHPEHRGFGYGKELLRCAETTAKCNSCGLIVVSTFSFQAPTFYEQNGYVLEHTIDNFPIGHSCSYYTKKLS